MRGSQSSIQKSKRKETHWLETPELKEQQQGRISHLKKKGPVSPDSEPRNKSWLK